MGAAGAFLLIGSVSLTHELSDSASLILKSKYNE